MQAGEGYPHMHLVHAAMFPCVCMCVRVHAHVHARMCVRVLVGKGILRRGNILHLSVGTDAREGVGACLCVCCYALRQFTALALGGCFG